METLKNKNAKRGGLLVIMSITLLLSVFSAGPAYAAGGTAYHGRGIDWMHGIAGGIPFDATDRYATEDGSVAYCLNLFVSSPDPSGTYYPDQFTPSQEVIAALYYGYPNQQVFGGVWLNDDQARAATQFAVWALNTSGYGDQLDLGTLMVEYGVPGGVAESQKVIDATNWLFQKALGGLPDPAAQIIPPADTSAQSFNDDFRRIGPFSLARSIHATATLSDVPQNAYLGDVNGSPIQDLVNGSFYLYLPVNALSSTGSGTIRLDAEFNIPSAIAYTGAPSLQNVGKYVQYVGGNGGDYKVSWFAVDVEKQDSETGQPVADTDFTIEQQDVNGVWQPLSVQTTDENGKLVFPGLGTGTWQIREIRPNPEYASCEESGDASTRILTIAQGVPPETQIFKNSAITISCQVDKDTIRKTSAAYRSIPGEENIDNVGVESYRYNIDYRSTSSVTADEFTVDDPLEAVSEGKIRVSELWSPVCYGDYDGKMNIWYKTNKTDDAILYSDVCAMSANPLNPNNPMNTPVLSNIGWVLWAQDIPTDVRTHLPVADLGLAADEYITAIRYEHGAVLQGFTTKNYDNQSQNEDHHVTEKEGIYTDHVDWTPMVGQLDYSESAANALGLKPVSYLVVCPQPLDENQVIHSSAQAHIARNLVLTDVDKDEVYTVPIGTFTLTGHVPEHSKNTMGRVPDTGDNKGGAINLLLIGTALSAFATFLFVSIVRKEHSKLRVVVLLAILFPALAILGTSTETGSVYALSYEKTTPQTQTEAPKAQSEIIIPQTIEQGGMTFQKIDSHSTQKNDKNEQEVFCRFSADRTISSSDFRAEDARNYLPSTLSMDEKTYHGSLLLIDVKTDTSYLSIGQKADRTEVLYGLSSDEISSLPEEKTFELLSDSAPGATAAVVMKRAGVHVSPVTYDEDGLPNLWDATIVYRGLESYLVPDTYTVHGVYAGSVTQILDSPPLETDAKPQKVARIKTVESITQPETNVPLKKGSFSLKPLFRGILEGEPRALAIGIGAPLIVAAVIIFLVALRRKMKRVFQVS